MAKMIPGFSGSFLAMTFGVYEKTLDIIANLRALTKEKLLYLLLLGMGIIIGIIIFSYCVKFLLETIYFPIMLLFTGLIIGNMREIWLNVKTYNHPVLGSLIFIISFVLVSLLSANKMEYNMFIHNSILYWFLGLIESATTLIPGISGTAIYMMLGVYNLILDLYINIFDITNIVKIFFYFSGFGLGIIFLAKVLTFILKRYKEIVYIIIGGFMTAAIYSLISDVLWVPFNYIDVLIGVILLLMGYTISSKLNHLF